MERTAHGRSLFKLPLQINSNENTSTIMDTSNEKTSSSLAFDSNESDSGDELLNNKSVGMESQFQGSPFDKDLIRQVSQSQEFDLNHSPPLIPRRIKLKGRCENYDKAPLRSFVLWIYSNSTRINYDENNPKQPESLSYFRYEWYKGCVNSLQLVLRMLEYGRTKSQIVADLEHDI